MCAVCLMRLSLFSVGCFLCVACCVLLFCWRRYVMSAICRRCRRSTLCGVVARCLLLVVGWCWLCSWLVFVVCCWLSSVVAAVRCSLLLVVLLFAVVCRRCSLLAVWVWCVLLRCVRCVAVGCVLVVVCYVVACGVSVGAHCCSLCVVVGGRVCVLLFVRC